MLIYISIHYFGQDRCLIRNRNYGFVTGFWWYKTCHEHFDSIIDAYFEIILSKTDDLKNFGDLQVTTNYPYDGLEYISKDKTHDIHIMIQRNGSMKN